MILKVFLKECISDSYDTESAKNVLSTLNVIRKNNLNTLIFAKANIKSIRSKFDMLASQVKGTVMQIEKSLINDRLCDSKVP